MNSTYSQVQGRHYAALAAQLKKMGYRKTEYWTSAYWHKHLHEHKLGESYTVTIRVKIYNNNWSGHDWVVDQIVTDGKTIVSRPHQDDPLQLALHIDQLRPLMNSTKEDK